MHSFMQEMLGGDGNKEARDRIWSLWEVSRATHPLGWSPFLIRSTLQEYEARETPESKLVKDLDRLELILQAIEYERCEFCIQPRASLPAMLTLDATVFSAQDVRTLAPFFAGSMREFQANRDA